MIASQTRVATAIAAVAAAATGATAGVTRGKGQASGSAPSAEKKFCKSGQGEGHTFTTADENSCFVLHALTWRHSRATAGVGEA